MTDANKTVRWASMVQIPSGAEVVRTAGEISAFLALRILTNSAQRYRAVGAA